VKSGTGKLSTASASKFDGNETKGGK